MMRALLFWARIPVVERSQGSMSGLPEMKLGLGGCSWAVDKVESQGSPIGV